MYAVGLMSGTSMDGVDAVCIQLAHGRFTRVVARASLPFSEALRADLLALQTSAADGLHRAQLLAQTLGGIYAAVSEKLFRQPEMQGICAAVIGCHGQTVRHRPDCGYSIQLADWAALAEKTALPVAGGFRAADLAAGGQGAPLVPAFHAEVFGGAAQNSVIANLGGIANITVLADGRATAGFDTGPGNMLMDAWTQKYFGRAFDENGAYARRGKRLPELLAQWLAHGYFSRKPPKSAGREQFSLDWAEKFLHGGENPHDVLHTLADLTAESLAAAVEKYAPAAEKLILCGGGAKNLFLREKLAFRLPEISIETADAYALPVQDVEAAAFAWLAARCLYGVPVPLAHLTGARGNRVLGALWRPFAENQADFPT